MIPLMVIVIVACAFGYLAKCVDGNELFWSWRKPTALEREVCEVLEFGSKEGIRDMKRLIGTHGDSWASWAYYQFPRRRKMIEAALERRKLRLLEAKSVLSYLEDTSHD